LRGRWSAAGRVLTVVPRRGLPLPQDPTACLGSVSIRHPRSRLRTAGTGRGREDTRPTGQCSTHEHHPGTVVRAWLWAPRP